MLICHTASVSKMHPLNIFMVKKIYLWYLKSNSISPVPQSHASKFETNIEKIDDDNFLFPKPLDC